MEQLRRLDHTATRKGFVLSLVLAILGCLLLGIGMSCTMVWMESLFFPGVIIGLVGILALIAVYPLYSYVTKKQREKLAPQILKLADELSHPEETNGFGIPPTIPLRFEALPLKPDFLCRNGPWLQTLSRKSCIPELSVHFEPISRISNLTFHKHLFSNLKTSIR